MKIPWQAIAILGCGLLIGQMMSSNIVEPYFHQSSLTVLWSMPWISVIINIFTVAWFLFTIVLAGVFKFDNPRRLFFLVAAFAVTMALLLVGRQYLARQTGGAFLGTTDGAVQTEVATQFLVRGQNPYTADYQQTIYGIVPGPAALGGDNLAYDAYVYPPLLPMLTTITIPLARLTGMLAETRLLGLVAMVIIWILAMRLEKKWDHRSIITLIILANPFILPYVAAGFNDIVMTASLVASALFLLRRCWAWSAVFMALAVGLKQTAWPLAIWWLILGIAQIKREPHLKKPILRAILFKVIITLAIFSPFIINDWSAIWHDLVVFPSGSI